MVVPGSVCQNVCSPVAVFNHEMVLYAKGLLEAGLGDVT
jgi:hypothetical protein